MAGLVPSLGAPMFMKLADIGLFLRSARSDARLRGLWATSDSKAAFDELYSGAPENDPWGSAGPQFLYQRHKYDSIISLVPQRRYRRAIDLGCGGGLFSQRLAAIADEVVGLDVSSVAVEQATHRAEKFPNLRFMQGDILHLPDDLDGGFDLVTILDAIYYLPPPIEDAMLKALVLRLTKLAAPGGTIVIANHYFSGQDADSRLSRRIHDAFIWSPALQFVAQYRRAFFLTTVLKTAGHCANCRGVPLN